jgi:pimeloyl-ACP methyl ester carboxylesterase
MQLTSGKTVLVGSSMGGWISLLLAKKHPERIAGLVGIAAAPDFTATMRVEMDDEARAEMEATGRWSRPSDYSDEPYVITRKLLDDGHDNLVLTMPLRLGHPVHLLQGTSDKDVPVELALRLFGHVDGPDTRLTLVKGADHRFSEEREIALLIRTIEEIV